MAERDRGSVAAVILAAGLGSRFAAADSSHASKLVAPLAGTPLVRHVALAAGASRAAPVVVVTGHAAEAVRAALADLPIRFAHNPDFATGLASSLKTGLAQLPDEASAALILLGDMPQVAAAALDQLIALFEAHPECVAVVPKHAGTRGNPALLTRRLFPRVALLKGDQGARRLLEEAGDGVVEWEADAAVALDVDTPEQLRQSQEARAQDALAQEALAQDALAQEALAQDAPACGASRPGK